VARAVAYRRGGIAYCFIVRDGALVASSLPGPLPEGLLAVRPQGNTEPVVIKSGVERTLDLVEPILDKRLGEVRIGVDLRVIRATRSELTAKLGILAIAVTLAGLFAAVVLGRSIAQPVREILSAADRFDPASDAEAPWVAPRGSDEIAVLVDRFNRMMARLKNASAEQARSLQKSMESERLVALGSLVAGVAHEVNNPLAGLKNCVRRLERNDLSSAKHHEYLELMDESLDRIAAVVRRLLDFGRPHPTQLRPMGTLELAEAGARMIQPLLHRRHIRCDLDPAEGGGTVLIDRHKLEQAMMTLLLNAAYVTPDGGTLVLRLRRRAGQEGISVVDRGPGIPPELRERVLDPFFSTKPEGEGTGLGLTVTRSLVNAHGGELGFEFPDAGGTIVTVWLPGLAASATQDGQPASA
jgi:signal transduction histidine kinase